MLKKTKSVPTGQPVGAGFRPDYLTSNLPSSLMASDCSAGNSETDQSARGKVRRTVLQQQNLGTSRSEQFHDGTDSHLNEAPSKPSRQMRRAAPTTNGIDISGDGYLRLKEVLFVYPVSRAGWYEGMRDGIYPQSVQLGKRAVGWLRQSIRDLIANPPPF
jgi:predicted DNA-binding transcriptional regulator AlpA